MNCSCEIPTRNNRGKTLIPCGQQWPWEQNRNMLNHVFHLHLYSAYSFNGTFTYMVAQDPRNLETGSTGGEAAPQEDCETSRSQRL